jgi:predicted Zn-dependent protease
MKSTIFRTYALGIIFIASFIFSCARNPVTGKRQFMLISERQEKAMGLAYDPQVIQEFGLYEDKIMQDFISDYGKRMGRVSHRPAIGYEFRIRVFHSGNHGALQQRSRVCGGAGP